MIIPAETTLQGGLTNTGLGTVQLAVEPSAGASNGITVSGLVAVAGALKISATSAPVSGQSFPVVQGLALTGTFATTTTTGAHFTIGYTSTACTATALS